MQLSEEQCQHFRREHYLVVRDVLPAGAIEAMRRELDEAVEYGARRLVSSGRLGPSELHEDTKRTPSCCALVTLLT